MLSTQWLHGAGACINVLHCCSTFAVTSGIFDHPWKVKQLPILNTHNVNRCISVTKNLKMNLQHFNEF